jgi:hypothetical protein
MKVKVIGFMNGWKDAPHCWKRFLFLPLVAKHYAVNVYEVGIFGFLWFVEIGA